MNQSFGSELLWLSYIKSSRVLRFGTSNFKWHHNNTFQCLDLGNDLVRFAPCGIRWGVNVIPYIPRSFNNLPTAHAPTNRTFPRPTSSISFTANVATMSSWDFCLTDSPTRCRILWNTPRTMSMPMLISAGLKSTFTEVWKHSLSHLLYSAVLEMSRDC